MGMSQNELKRMKDTRRESHKVPYSTLVPPHTNRKE